MRTKKRALGTFGDTVRQKPNNSAANSSATEAQSITDSLARSVKDTVMKNMSGPTVIHSGQIETGRATLGTIAVLVTS